MSSSGNSSEVLYRKWRPQSFSEVVGQDPITQTVRNSLASGRVAHAYLFCGPRGTGKTSMGRLLAKAVNCLQPADGEPCNTCESCQAYLEGRAMDLVEMDAASNRGIDEIRKLRDRVGLAPMAGEHKIYLVDEVHMLTAEAYNALLKTLEEPPPHIIFILATTESHKVPATIISRCQRFDFHRLPLAAVVSRLEHICKKEGIKIEAAALQEIARSASGSLRDAINLVEQLSNYYGSSPSLEQVRDSLGLTADARGRQLVRHVLEKDLSAGLKLIAAVRDDGVDMRQFQREVVNYLRALLVAKAGAEDTLDLGAEEVEEMRSVSSAAASEDILRALRGFGQADFRDDPQSSLPLELALADQVLGPSAAAQVAAEETEPVARPPFPSGRQGEPRQPPKLRTRLQESERQAPKQPPKQTKPAAPTGGAESQPSKAAVPSGEGEKEPSKPAAPAGEGESQPAEAAPAAETTAAAGDDLLQRIRLACKGVDHRVAAYLNGTCEIKSLEDGVLVLAFYQQFGLHKGKIETPDNRRIVAEAASRLVGQTITVECTVCERQRAEGKPSMRGGHLVQAAREMGARPVVGGKGGSSGEPRNET
ncbi:MAG: DNA polymerase III subunit gamma/tau [Dehalococcoidia bacterium]|nr:MAG: DNA polymerase III subunit gamma/tau [Dehalococcoidia bacterium]